MNYWREYSLLALMLEAWEHLKIMKELLQNIINHSQRTLPQENVDSFVIQPNVSSFASQVIFDLLC